MVHNDKDIKKFSILISIIIIGIVCLIKDKLVSGKAESHFSESLSLLVSYCPNRQ